jgi:succinate-semialdehyde dehydrogenase / glutarate-semialdehyde dehydrogenase
MTQATTAPARMLIDGNWCDADDGGTLGVVNPATEEVLVDVPYGGRKETRRALEAAARAMPDWRRRNAWERGKILKRTADLLRERADAIARTLTEEQGKTLAESKGEVLHSADTFEWFAEEGKRAYGDVIPNSAPGTRHFTLKHPVGVVGAISPWNFPITLQSRKIAPALAAGCTIVCKPASQTPLCLTMLFDCLLEAGLPDGVANLVIGSAEEVADEFLENPVCRKISFTGSTEVGKSLLRGCADQMKRVSLELGGHAPFIVFPDADPEAVAKFAVTGKFRNNGQVCISPTRFYVHRDTSRAFTEAAVSLTRALKLGNGVDPQTEIGPMFEKKGLEQSIAFVDDARAHGAEVLTGGGRSEKFEKGYFFEPTVLRGVSREMRVMREEPFAPVMSLLEFGDVEEVIRAANDTPYGLAAYVFTNDLTTAWQVCEGLEAGIIGLNDPVPATPQCPFGGMKESGLGRELAHEGLEAYLETKGVSMKLRDPMV